MAADEIVIPPTEEQAPVCEKCGLEIKSDEASHIDPRFHKFCFGDITVTESFGSKTEEEYDEVSQSVIRRKDTFKRIQVSGKDWVWHTRRIAELTDTELERNIEYHRSSVYLIESLLTQRKVESYQKLKGEKVVIHKSIETSGKKQVTTKKSDAEALLKKLLKLGMSKDQIAAMLAVDNSPKTDGS